jgi:hypothetical protein
MNPLFAFVPVLIFLLEGWSLSCFLSDLDDEQIRDRNPASGSNTPATTNISANINRTGDKMQSCKLRNTVCTDTGEA